MIPKLPKKNKFLLLVVWEPTYKNEGLAWKELTIFLMIKCTLSQKKLQMWTMKESTGEMLQEKGLKALSE